MAGFHKTHTPGNVIPIGFACHCKRDDLPFLDLQAFQTCLNPLGLCVTVLTVLLAQLWTPF